MSLVEQIGKATKVYVEESGTDAQGWKYRKWSNGDYEARKTASVSTTTMSGNGSVFLCTAPMIALPSGITDIKITGFASGGNINLWLGSVYLTGITLFRGTNTAGALDITFEVRGRWK